MSGYYSDDADIPITIALTIIDKGMGFNVLTRRVVFDKDGALKDNRYLWSKNIDCDEETLRLLRDTLKGMEAELNRLSHKTKEKA